MKARLLVVCVISAAVFASVTAQQPQPASQGLRIFIRAGEKTHGAGDNGNHDYPAFLGSWSTLLKDRGAVVDGALHFPTADELARTDVLINFKGDGGTCSVSERALLENFLKRGGGIVTMHDGMCSDDADWFKNMVGAAKQHGERNSSSGALRVTFVDKTHEITRGIADFDIDDEAFFLLRTTPEMHPLATSVIPSSKEVVPQIWTAERTLAGGKPFRSFVYMLGHKFSNWSKPEVQTLMLRGIAWAGRRPVDLLTNPPAAAERGGGAGGRGGRGAGRGADPATPAAGRGAD
jgi:type 1 glutamine amidotransferase